jgi:hypothetical protein
LKASLADRQVGTLQPEKRRYVSSAMPMTEAAIDRNLWRDRYVSLGEPLAGEPPQWSFRVYHKPFVSWIWLGAVFMVLGGGLAAFDRRYRQAPAGPRCQRLPVRPSLGLCHERDELLPTPQPAHAALGVCAAGAVFGHGGVFGRGPDAQPARDSLAAHWPPRTGF